MKKENPYFYYLLIMGALGSRVYTEAVRQKGLWFKKLLNEEPVNYRSGVSNIINLSFMWDYSNKKSTYWGKIHHKFDLDRSSNYNKILNNFSYLRKKNTEQLVTDLIFY